MKATMRVTAVVEICDLATLKRYYENSQGRHFESLSKLINLSLSQFVGSLIMADIVEGFDNSVDARTYLETAGVNNKALSKGTYFQILKELQGENFGENKRLGSVNDTPEGETSSMIADEVKAVMDSMKSNLSDQKKAASDAVELMKKE
jgi:hypothetical protein